MNASAAIPNLPNDLLTSMKACAKKAGLLAKETRQNNALNVAQKIEKDGTTIVTEADILAEKTIRKALEHYGYNILGEEKGHTKTKSSFSFIIDPIDGTTNFEMGDPDWLVSIGLLYNKTPVAGVTYQPDLDKFCWASIGQGAYVQKGDEEPKKLKIKAGIASTYAFNVSFVKHPDADRQNAFISRLYEEIPDVIEKLYGVKSPPKYRDSGCPSVPICLLAEGARAGVIAKPVKIWDIAAAVIIATEAGAKVHIEPENPNKTALEDNLKIIVAREDLFADIMRIFNETVNRSALSFSSITDKNIKAQLSKNNIKYGAVVGRRQPMHIVHLECIKEIANNGLKPIVIIGSSNLPDSEYYDPYKNPLNEDQQRIQIEVALKEVDIENYSILTLRDRGSMQWWASTLRYELNKGGFKSNEVVFYYRTKTADLDSLEAAIKPLSAYDEEIQKYGISTWQSINKNSSYDSISATPFRSMDVNSQKFKTECKNLVAPNYIKQLVNSARANNPDVSLLSGIPPTLLDLTLERLRLEKDIFTRDILDNKTATSIKELEDKTKKTVYSL